MNIAAVAQRAGVSKATVSRVMNGTANVVPETARRVREAIEALDFYPDVNARALGSGRSRLYGLIISDIMNPYFPELVKAFEDIAHEHGQDVLISNTDYDPARTEACVVRMLQRKVDGVAVMTSEMDERLIRTFSKRQIPTIFMDIETRVRGAAVVRVNYAGGIAQAMTHLVGLGHKQIAFLSGPLSLASAAERVEAYRSAMRAHGLAFAPHWVQEGNHRVDGGSLAMTRMLHTGKRPTALLCSNDLTAIGAMGALHDFGLSIPGDVSVVGFDDIQISAYTQPALTTVHVSRRELAATAFRSLYVGNSDKPGKTFREGYVIEPRLLLRGSTGPAPRRSGGTKVAGPSASARSKPSAA